MTTKYRYGRGVGHLRPLYSDAWSVTDVYKQLAQSCCTTLVEGSTLEEIYKSMNVKPGFLRGQVDFVEGSKRKFEIFDTLAQLKTILLENKEETHQQIYLYENKGFFARH